MVEGTVEGTGRTEVSGLLLRYAILAVMEGVTRPAGVREIADSIGRFGVRTPSREGKLVSDALRTEVRKGRVMRVGRDLYVGGHPLSERTRSRIQASLREACRTGIGNKGLW
jgi:hypothetical protein